MLKFSLIVWARPLLEVLCRQKRSLGSGSNLKSTLSVRRTRCSAVRRFTSNHSSTSGQGPEAAETPAERTQEELLSTVEELLSKPWTGEFESNLEPLEPSLERARNLLAQAQASWSAGKAPTGASPSVRDRAYVHDLHLLFLVKEMAPAASLLAETALDLLRMRMDESGLLGNETKPASMQLEEQMEETIRAYEKATCRLENARERALRDAPVRASLWDHAIRKWEQDLGIHIVQLRQSMSMEGYSERFGTITAHRILPSKFPATEKSNQST
ncbi:hypothetical protein CCYA_CCYA01G0392 [Cyanidiococcus yangmingshanensis]|nr:hypothetical protein CCYA_CCYA01G0392 [Cyanidiococcus yangmingshanensis]